MEVVEAVLLLVVVLVVIGIIDFISSNGNCENVKISEEESVDKIQKNYCV